MIVTSVFRTTSVHPHSSLTDKLLLSGKVTSGADLRFAVGTRHLTVSSRPQIGQGPKRSSCPLSGACQAGLYDRLGGAKLPHVSRLRLE